MILKPKQSSLGMVDKIVLTRRNICTIDFNPRYLQEKLDVIIFEVHGF
jgi:hypothetical protein